MGHSVGAFLSERKCTAVRTALADYSYRAMCTAHVHVCVFVSQYLHQPFNAGIKSLLATLPAEIFYWGF
jgi:hypothetical protein